MKFLKEFDEIVKIVARIVSIIGGIAIVLVFFIGIAKDVDVLQRDVEVLQIDLAELKTEVRAEFEKIDEKFDKADEKADARYEKITETLSIIRSDIAGLKGNSNIKTNASH